MDHLPQDAAPTKRAFYRMQFSVGQLCLVMTCVAISLGISIEDSMLALAIAFFVGMNGALALGLCFLISRRNRRRMNSELLVSEFLVQLVYVSFAICALMLIALWIRVSCSAEVGIWDQLSRAVQST